MRSVAQSLVNFTQELSVLNRGLIKTLYFDSAAVIITTARLTGNINKGH